VNKKTIAILICLIIVFLFLFIRFRTKPPITSNSSTVKWVDCTSKISDNPQKYSDWSTKLYAAKLEDKSSDNEATTTNTRTFELSKLADKKDTDSIYYRVQRDVFPQNYVTGSKVVMEMCNDKNQTPQWYSTTWEKIPESGEKISARVTHMHSTQQVLVPGKYRIDAYFYIDGKWHFSDRIEGVELK
jgi:hypothetical protein